MRTSHNSPWIIEDRAARDLLRMTGRSDGQLVDAMTELREYARGCVERDAQPRTLQSGMVQYRGGKPLRPRLIVDPGPPRRLIEVRPDHEGRVGPYTRTRAGQHAGQRPLTLRELRESLDVSQVELAALMGVTQGGLSKMEDHPNPPIDTLRSAVRALGGRLELRVRIGDPERVITLKLPEKPDAVDGRRDRG